MPPASSERLVILSGPSCVGKSPLHKALARFHPELSDRLHKLVLMNSRAPRPGEFDGKDYHFRTRSQIESLKADSRYVVLEVRGDLQALDVRELKNVLQNGDAFFEGNPFMGRVLETHPSLADFNRLSIFLSPLSREEITYLKAQERHISLEEFVTDVMRRKLLRRVRRQKGELSVRDLENVETRASSAFRELQEAWHFQYVIPNHDGEDSDHWEAFYFLIGDARKTLDAFVDLLKGSVPPGIEQWNEKLLSPAN
jgi:guanylate kinase